MGVRLEPFLPIFLHHAKKSDRDPQIRGRIFGRIVLINQHTEGINPVGILAGGEAEDTTVVPLEGKGARCWCRLELSRVVEKRLRETAWLKNDEGSDEEKEKVYALFHGFKLFSRTGHFILNQDKMDDKQDHQSHI